MRDDWSLKPTFWCPQPVIIISDARLLTDCSLGFHPWVRTWHTRCSFVRGRWTWARCAARGERNTGWSLSRDWRNLRCVSLYSTRPAEGVTEYYQVQTVGLQMFIKHSNIEGISLTINMLNFVVCTVPTEMQIGNFEPGQQLMYILYTFCWRSIRPIVGADSFPWGHSAKY